MEIFEKFVAHIEEYPDAKDINPILHDVIMNTSRRDDIGAEMKQCVVRYDALGPNCMNAPEFKYITDFAYNIVNGWYDDDVINMQGKLELESSWGQYYYVDDYHEIHDHYPNQWAFVYYVNTPEGSSPLVFVDSGKEFYGKAGQIIIFPGLIKHYVPPNKCEGRSVIAGNFIYKFNETVDKVYTMPYI